MSNPDVTKKNSWEIAEDKVVLFDDLGSEIIHDILEPASSWSEVPQEIIKSFFEKFEVVKGKFPGNPEEDYYQGMEFTRVIRDKDSGNLYGYTYWEDISKHGETFLESNGDEFGYDFDWDDDYYPSVYVFLPVREFSVKGFEVVK